MAIVKDCYIGSTRIMIDDCMCKIQTPEERQEIKDNFARIYYRELANQMCRKEEEKAANAK